MPPSCAIVITGAPGHQKPALHGRYATARDPRKAPAVAAVDNPAPPAQESGT